MRKTADASIDTLIDKIDVLRKQLNSRVLERTSETEGILLAILSGVSCLFLGDVGTAKTMQVQLAAKMLGLSTFDILLSETTKPEHIFGPTDIPALAKGVQRTKIDGYAPSAEVLFFDEIFKANAIVLNPLLWLINEKIYRNGDDGIIQCPVKATFAASNEIPTDSMLKAIYDRMVLRYEVFYLKTEENMRQMMTSFLAASEVIEPLFTQKEVEKLRRAVKQIEVPDEIKDIVIKIRHQVQEACNITISDRRLAQSLRVIQANALLAKRKQAEIQDTEILANIFWSKPEQRSKVQTIVLAHASSDIGDILSYEEEADSFWNRGVQTGDMLTAAQKIRALLVSLKTYTSPAGRTVYERIRAKYRRAKSILEDRKTLHLTKISLGKSVIYKLNAASASLWTIDQLRKAGFKYRRTGSYWYVPKGGTSKIKVLGAQVKIKSLTQGNSNGNIASKQSAKSKAN